WTIMRIGHTLTGAQNFPAPDSGRGWEVDKLSREALDEHWKHAIVPLLEDSGALAGKTFKNVLIDSYEMGSQNWTPKMREEFMKRCGYDLLPFLLVAAGGRVVDSLDISERFLWDFRRTIADLFAENYYGYFGELCRKNGLLLWVEPYGNGPFDDITAGSKADVPMSEFWLGHGLGIDKDWIAKLASSIAHIYGKQVVGAESFTAGPPYSGWIDYPYYLKPLGDLIFCSGVNRYVFHTFAHQPWLKYKPGNTMGPWGFQFNRNTTWWDDAPAWLTYVARCEYLLQQGLFVGDVLFYVGENSPVSIRTSQPLPPSYDFDACDTPTLLERLSVKGNKLYLPHGMSYEVLVLPNEREMTPKVLRKIRELVKAGAWVIGPKPLRSPSLVDYPKADEEIKKLANEVWGNLDGQKITERKYGKGRVFWGKSVEEVLKLKGVKPDFEFEGTLPGTAINYIHRKTEEADIYFLSNQRERFETVKCRFRVKGKVPELWHPDTGKVEIAPIFRFFGDRTEVTINFEPYGSLFVIFRQPTRARKAIAQVLHNNKDAFLPSLSVVGKLEIVKAIYGILEDPSKQVDVTEHLRKMVKNNMLFVVAGNAIAGDPAPFVVKKMRIDYKWNNEPHTIIVNENELVEIPKGVVGKAPDVKLSLTSQGKAEVLAFEAGDYEILTTTGKKIKLTIPSVPKPIEVSGPWEVHFPPNWGAPEKAVFDKLISWSEHPDEGIKYFSGTAKYVKEIEIPKEAIGKDKTVILDLGDVEVIARARLNGKDLGIIWKKPFQVDITDVVKPGKNLLEVEVTNLWVNRLIGDEHLPADREYNPDGSLKEIPSWVWEGKPSPTGRYTFATWRHYSKDSPLRVSGLLGPVRILIGVRKGANL
ncbi:MAG: glycosyl hydrolase, partial [bacterium]